MKDKTYIFDKVRKKYVFYNPEEKVRQYMVQYLVEQLGYPRCLMTLEENIEYGDLYKRIDILIRSRGKASPLMLVECKASHCKIHQKHLDQLAMYNTVLKAPFISLTNGVKHVCFKLERIKKGYTLLAKIPSFNEILQKYYAL